MKAHAQFPQILGMLGDQLDWTRRLGEAFLAQWDDLMDAVQHRAAQQHVATPTPTVILSRERFRGSVEEPRAEQPRAEQPRAEQGRPEPGRGGQEVTWPSVQSALRREPSRPNPIDSSRAQARVQGGGPRR